MKLKCWLALFFSAQVGFAQIPKEKIFPLDTVFALAEQNSTHLKISKSLSETALRAVDVAQNLRLPSFEVGLSALYLGDAMIFDRDFSNAQNAAMPHSGNNFSAEASYVVFAGGAVSKAIEKAELESQIAALAYSKNRMDIRMLVAGQYLDLYKLYNQKTVFNKNIEETNELIRHVKAKLLTDMALDNDLTRHELLLQNLKLAIIEIENNISIINKHLTITLGLPDETIIIPDSSVQNLQNMSLTGKNVYENALKNRPDIKIQSLQKDVAQKQIKLAKAQMYPSLAIIGADHFDGPITFEVPPIDKNINYWYVGIGIKYNLASLYTSRKNVTLAEICSNTANYSYDAELENTRIAIYTAQTQYSEAFEKLYTYQKNVQLARENYVVVNNRYKNDLALITEMLDASNTKLKAELQVINAKLDVVFNYYKLQREIGTL